MRRGKKAFHEGDAIYVIMSKDPPKPDFRINNNEVR
jgi:hypothetical protein